MAKSDKRQQEQLAAKQRTTNLRTATAASSKYNAKKRGIQLPDNTDWAASQRPTG